MATDTQVLLHPVDWSHAVIFTPIPESLSRLTLQTSIVASAMTSFVGAGQPATYGLVIGTCFFPSPSTATPCNQTVTPSPIDPPVTTIINTGAGPYGRDYMNTNLRMFRRDDYSFNFAVTLNGLPLDITGGDLRFTAKWSVKDADAAAVIALQSNNGNGIVITNATGGLATATIPSSATTTLPSHRVDLPYDIQLYDKNGKTSTVMYGTLTILPDITWTAN